MPRVTYAVVTFGCRVNQADSLRLEGALRDRGAVPATPDTAALVVVNTCSVTASADHGARQAIRRVARTNPAARIVATGCYATRCADDVAALPGVVRVVSNLDKDDLADHLYDQLELTTAERFGGGDGACGSPVGPGAGGRTAFMLRLQTGCSQTCAYCIIPTTRGRPRSLPPADAVRAARRAVEAGYREVTLTGVHLGSYGRDLEPATTLGELLGRLADEVVHPEVVFRLSSLEPMDCGDDVVDRVTSDRRFAPHLHLPLQHASDRVLSAMRRPYTLARYARLVDRIRLRLPHAAIGADLIAGFPGETAAEFEMTRRYVAGSPLTYLHVFPYSDRPGTAASAMGDRVAPVEIRRRARALRAVGGDLAAAFRRRQGGTVRRALTLDAGSRAVTDNYLKVAVDHDVGRNRWISVRLSRDASEGVRVTSEP